MFFQLHCLCSQKWVLYNQLLFMSFMQKVSELWEMIRYMSEVPPRATGDPLASRVLPQVRNVLISQARKYLEDRFVKSQFHWGSDAD
jgi:hypothetical protein